MPHNLVRNEVPGLVNQYLHSVGTKIVNRVPRDCENRAATATSFLPIEALSDFVVRNPMSVVVTVYPGQTLRVSDEPP
jgi:hypothetical protein